MNANNTPSSGYENQRLDPTAEVLRQQWINAIRQSETREAEYHDRLENRRARSKMMVEKLTRQIENLEREYEDDRTNIRNAIEVCKQEVHAAHVAASRHCGEIGVNYEPGKTKEADILRVPTLSESEAARKLDLTHGSGMKNEGRTALKIFSAVLCAFVSSVAWGALIAGVNLKHPLANIPGAIFALVLGIATSLIVWRFLSHLWSHVGAKAGAGRPREEVRAAIIAALAQTAFVLVGLMALDGLGLIRANAAKATLNPLFAIPLWLAFLAAGFINLAYVSGMSYAAFAEGYNEAARKTVRGLIDSDEATKQEDRKRYVHVQAALDALGQVTVAEQRLEGYKRELKQKEAEFRESFNALMEQMPKEQEGLTADEERELGVLRDKVEVAKNRYDAHLTSQSITIPVMSKSQAEEN